MTDKKKGKPDWADEARAKGHKVYVDEFPRELNPELFMPSYFQTEEEKRLWEEEEKKIRERYKLERERLLKTFSNLDEIISIKPD